MTSRDGVNWTARSAPNNDWFGIVWSPSLGLFAAVAASGTGNRVMTSPDGVTWTSRATPADNFWRAIAWSPELGLFAAVATSGTSRVMTSPDGITWTLRSAAAANEWRAITWSPALGLFAAVSVDGSNNRAMTSPDGINWTARATDNSGGWNGIAWSPQLGLFAAVGFNAVMTSADGVTWTRRPAPSQYWFGVAWAPELGLFAATSFINGTGTRAMASPDGVNWTLNSTPADLDWIAVAWSPALEMFAAVAITGTGNRVMTATNPQVRDFGSDKAYAFGAHAHGVFGADPVNLGTGSLTIRAHDLAMPGRVIGFDFTRWYNSADRTISPLGPGWTHSYEWTVTDLGSTAEVRRGDGRRDTFSRQPDGSYTAPSGVFDTLTKNADGRFTLTLTSELRFDFASTGALLSIREPAGNQVALAYTGTKLTTITDTIGRQVSLTYNAQNRLAQLQDPLGRKVTYSYDGGGRLVTVTDRIGNGAGPAAAYQWKYTYDGDTRHIRTVTDPDGRVLVTNTYDAQGRITEQRDGLGTPTTMAYSAGQTVVTDPRGHARTYTFDTRMRVLTQVDVVGASTYTLSYDYDAAGNRSRVTDRSGKATDFAYDARANLLTKTDPSPDGIAPRPVTTFSYDLKNNVTQVTDAAGAITTMTYDATTNVLLSVAREVSAGVVAATKYQYGDAASPGLPTRITAPRGNLAATPDPTYSTTLAYDAQGNLTRRTDADGAITTFSYDAVGRLTSFVDPDGNALGGVAALHTWTTTYDELDRETRRTDPLGGALAYAYDGAGGRTSLTDRNGNVTTYSYDANARLVQVQQKPDRLGPTIYTTTVTRDANGNATRITQANGVTTNYAFDALDRLTSVTTYPASTSPLVTSFVLDGNGQPTSRTTADGITVSYGYDALARLTTVSGPSLSIGYLYDAVGRRTQMTDATGSTTYQYDSLGRVTQIGAPNGTLSYAYDSDGNRTSLTYPGGDTVTYTYSPGGRMSTVTDWARRISSYRYKPSGVVASLAQHGGLAASYTYDSAQRLTSLVYTLASGSVTLASQIFTVDADGNRTALEESAQNGATITTDTFALAYDGLNRLLSSNAVLSSGLTRSETFSYDPATNINARTGPAATYTHDGSSRATGDGTRVLTWDGADRLTGRGADTFTYDALSRLSGATVAGATRTYAYDGDGLLARWTEGAVTSTFVWDAATAPAPLVQAGSDRVVHGLGPLYLARADGSTVRLVRDALGSVRAELSDADDVTKSFRYAAYGAVSDRAPAGAAPTLLGFTGELADPSGLIYLRARWYDPGIGRFMRRDPVSGAVPEPHSLNSYAYAAADPILYRDPSGLCAPPLTIACALAARAVVGGVVGAVTYTAGIAVTNIGRAATGERRGLFEGLTVSDLAISAASGAFGGAIGTASLGLTRVDQFYLNTLAGWVGGMASITLAERKDPNRDWITVVMSTAFAGYGAHLAPEGLRGIGVSLGLAVASIGYEQALSASPSIPAATIPRSGGTGK